jgi:hypothetical protein
MELCWVEKRRFFNAFCRPAARVASPISHLAHALERALRWRPGRHARDTVSPQIAGHRHRRPAGCWPFGHWLRQGRATLMDGVVGDTAAGCGKVPNRNSQPIRSVRQFHLISCCAGTGSLSMRLHHMSIEPDCDRRRCSFEETKKREFQRHARVRRGEARADRGLFGIN